MTPETYLSDWQSSQATAEQMIALLGQLSREHGVDVLAFGRPLSNASTIEIIKAHKVSKRYTQQEITPVHTYPLLSQLARLASSCCTVDIGLLASRYWQTHDDDSAVADFLQQELAQLPEHPANQAPCDVVLYGFGRIGRLVARLLLEKSGAEYPLKLRAIVVRGGRDGDLEKRASLLRRDSIHGPFNGSITVDEKHGGIVANGQFIKVIYANSPAEIDYTAYGIENALIVDNTGIWKTADTLGQHLEAKGSHKVLLTAPGGGELKNIVFGVNHQMIETTDSIVTAASCTTNAITPTLKVINDKFGIVSGHIETVHSYTNDQNLIDNYHKGERRGRAAALNMVLTSTGAAKAVAKALPELAGKLTGNAIRVPTANVSMAVANLELNQSVTRDEVNNYLRDIALYSPLSAQIDYTESTELVSSDMVGSRYAGVVDGAATIASGNRVVLYIWYDNEFGYSGQVVSCMEYMMGRKAPLLPASTAQADR